MDECFSNQLQKAPEDEEGFDQLNDETFGDVSASGLEDWEYEHEKFACSDQSTNQEDSEVTGGEEEDSYVSSQPALIFPPIPHFLNNSNEIGDELELHMHENEMERELRRLVNEDEDDETKDSEPFDFKHFLNQKDWGALNGEVKNSHDALPSNSFINNQSYSQQLHPNQEFMLRSQQQQTTRLAENKNIINHQQLEKMMLSDYQVPSNNNTPFPSSTFSSLPPQSLPHDPPSNSQSKPRMTLEELESMLINQQPSFFIHPSPCFPQLKNAFNKQQQQPQLESQQHLLQLNQLSHTMSMPHTGQQEIKNQNLFNIQPKNFLNNNILHPNIQEPNLQPQQINTFQQQQLLIQHQKMYSQQSFVEIIQKIKYLQHNSMLIQQQQHQSFLQQQEAQKNLNLFSTSFNPVNLKQKKYLENLINIKRQHYNYFQQQLQHINYLLQQLHQQYQQHQQQHRVITQPPTSQIGNQEVIPKQSTILIPFQLYHQQQFQQQQHKLQIKEQQEIQHQQQIAKEDMSYYNGLMEQREKDWLVKIQLLQLHTDNPFLDDYYYTCWSMKKLIKENRKFKKDNDRKMKKELNDQSEKISEEEIKNKKESEKEEGVEGEEEEDDEDNDDDKVERLLLSTQEKCENKTYRPVQYEGSLGKVIASSIYNPRQMINVEATPPPSDENKKQDTKKFKEILAKIEKGFDILLQADELEKKASSVAMEMRIDLENKRSDLISKLTSDLLLNSGHLLSQILGVRKGVVLVIRWISLLKERKLKVESINKILSRITSITKKDWCNEIMIKLFKCLKTIIFSDWSEEEVSVFMSQLMKNAKTEEQICKWMGVHLHNQLSCSICFLIILKMESLFQQSPSLSVSKQWIQITSSLIKLFTIDGKFQSIKCFKFNNSTANQSLVNFIDRINNNNNNNSIHVNKINVVKKWINNNIK